MKEVLITTLRSVLAVVTFYVATAIVLASCASTPKPPSPRQVEPVQVDKTTIQTWLDFFEPRD